MIDTEFKTQVFKEPKQWQSGLYYRLQMPESGGAALASMPALSNWINLDGITGPVCLASDACGQLHFIDAGECRLYRYDPPAGRLERIRCFGGRGSDPGQFTFPVRMITGRQTLWVVDPGNSRIQAFARENLQLTYLINDLAQPVDMAVSRDGRLLVLDQASRQIHLYDLHGRKLNKYFGADWLQEPVCCSLGRDGKLFVIDSTCDAFLCFDESGTYLGTVGDFTQIAAGYKPTVICVDGSGNIYVGDATVGGVYRFAADGSYLGQVPGFNGPVTSLAVDCRDNLYAAGPQGLALMVPGQRYSHEPGLYYSKSLDSGIENCQWHRAALQADIPHGTVLEVYYYSSDDRELRVAIDGILADPARSTQQKKEAINGMIPETAWVGPERDPADMLFREKTGRYLWLKVALFTYDETVTPSLSGMRIFYPRISYLRYLPAIYQEDPVSREFLERFLSLFESLYFDLETEISRLFRYFDPAATPSGFLPWLASWLDVALEEQWPEQKKRLLITEAYQLFRIKGTAAGIKRLLEIYTGKAPGILEQAAANRPMVIGNEFRLGINTILARTAIRGFRLGDDSILGLAALRDEAYSPVDPFLPMAHRFTVLLDFSEAEYGQYREGVVRLLDAEKPADTLYNLQIIGEPKGGTGSYVGINTRVDGYRAMKIGLDSTLGSSLIVVDTDESCGKVGRRSLLGNTTKLI